MSFTASELTVRNATNIVKTMLAYVDGNSKLTLAKLIGGVRRDTRASGAGTDGDFSSCGLDGQGNLYVVAAEKRAQLSSSPTVSTGGYVAGDVVGGKLSITSAARFSGGSLVVENVVLADKAAALTDVDLWLFGADPASSTFTDDAAFTIADADLAKVVGVLNVSLAYAAVNNGVLQYTPPAGLPVVLASGTTLYGVLVTRAAATLASTSDVTVILTVRQD